MRVNECSGYVSTKFRGHLRSIATPQGDDELFPDQSSLLKNFGDHFEKVTEQLFGLVWDALAT
jgi:hypothetical protein